MQRREDAVCQLAFFGSRMGKLGKRGLIGELRVGLELLRLQI